MISDTYHIRLTIATIRASLSCFKALLATNVAWVHTISTNFDIIIIGTIVLVLHSGMHYFQ